MQPWPWAEVKYISQSRRHSWKIIWKSLHGVVSYSGHKILWPSSPWCNLDPRSMPHVPCSSSECGENTSKGCRVSKWTGNTAIQTSSPWCNLDLEARSRTFQPYTLSQCNEHLCKVIWKSLQGLKWGSTEKTQIHDWLMGRQTSRAKPTCLPQYEGVRNMVLHVSRVPVNILSQVILIHACTNLLQWWQVFACLSNTA